jgi:hypothetical protein
MRRVDLAMARSSIHQLLATDVALDKLGARGISAEDDEQLLRNRHATVRNPRDGKRAFWSVVRTAVGC